MKLRAALILLIIGLMIPGCAVVHTSMSTGQEYNLDNTTLIQKGMSQQETTKLLGKPYATGKDSDGNTLYMYEQIHTSTSAFSGGIFVQGQAGSQTTTGGKVTIVFDAVTQKAKTIQYEIYGVDNYDKLKGGRHEKRT